MGRFYGNQFWSILADVKIYHVHSLLWRSETEWMNALYAWFNSTTNATISFKILVKIGPVVSMENRLTNGNCAATRLQFVDRRPFVVLAFENELEYWNSDVNAFIGHQFSTLCEILVRFGSVTLEFKTWETVWPASKILPHLVQLQTLGGGAVRHWRDQ